MSEAPNLDSVLAGTPRVLPQNLKIVCAVMILSGAVAAFLGFLADPVRTSGAVIFNFLYFAGVSQGGFMLAIALMLTQGRWGRPIKRIAEGFGVFFPMISAVFIVFLILGGIDVYPWTHADHPMPPHKAIYLTKGFFIMRMVFGLGFLSLLNLLYIRASLRPDLGTISVDMGDRAPAWWQRLTNDWQGVDSETESCVKRQMALASVLTIAYAIIFSFVAVDVSMSLAPHWFANMFPAWFFMSCVLSGMVWIGIYSLLARDWLGITHLLTPSLYHDLGKLTLGFTMFWGYTTFAQYLPIWYGNMTEEVGFILLRTELEPWAPMSKLVVLMCFLAPFAMLVNRSLKKIPSAYLAVSGVLAVGLWLERFMQVMPSIWMKSTLPLGVTEVGIAVGILGAFILVVSRFLAQVPPVPVCDPWMAPHPDDIHVHPSHSHA